ncbi:MAG: hypothetical protein E7211_20485 [Clostridium lundense]|nr:hypothetical protein [Clostridium lundense]
MPREPNPKVKEAEELFKKGLKLVEIANRLDIPQGTVRRWKLTYKWDNERSSKRGAPKGNKNAVGNGAPRNNKNAETHGFFSKYLPEETQELIKDIAHIDPLDMIWNNITIQFAAIIRSQKIMHVTDKDELLKVLKKKTRGEKSDTDEWEFQFAWDRQATFLNAQSRAMSELRSLIKQYDEMLNKNWDLATEEQKARIALLKAKVDTGEDGETEDDGFLDALKGQVNDVWEE